MTHYLSKALRLVLAGGLAAGLAMAAPMGGASAQSGAAAETKPPVKTPVKTPVIWFCAPAKYRIALDIGHTPEVPGAISARGIGEYDFNKRLAEETLEALREAGFSRSFILNRGGEEITLGERTAQARRKGADLFISLHHDSVLPQFLKPWTYEGQALEFTDYARGHSIFVAENGREAKRSLAAARLLGNRLREIGLTPTYHHAEPIRGANRKLVDRYAGIYDFGRLAVLRSAKMPALLFEGGVIKNPEEEALLNDPLHRAKLVSAIVHMAKGMCD